MTLLFTNLPYRLVTTPLIPLDAPLFFCWAETSNYEFISHQTERKRNSKKLTISVHKRFHSVLRSRFSIERICWCHIRCCKIKEQRMETLVMSGWDKFALALESRGRIPKGIMKLALGARGEILWRCCGWFLGNWIESLVFVHYKLSQRSLSHYTAAKEEVKTSSWFWNMLYNNY